MITFAVAGELRPRSDASVLVKAIVRGAALCALMAPMACSDLPNSPESAVEPSLALVGTAFTDDFGSFDATRWGRSTHTLGRSPLNPANIVIAGDSVRLNTTSNPYEGAEIWTWEQYGTGTFTVRGRCAVPAGALCAFFMYQGGVGDAADEIDVEILGGTRTIWFTTWVRGKRTNHRAVTLPFAPDAGMHSYTIVRNTAEIRFLVDGVERAKFKGKAKLPQAKMPLYANAWWPTWLTPAGGTGAWVIDRIAAQ
jgi:hypothetical protein